MPKAKLATLEPQIRGGLHKMPVLKSREQLLRKTLAARARPGVVTDLVAGTLSDRDREAQLRAHAAFAEDRADLEARLRIPDRGLLREIAAGF